jgi:DASS family divalent anion:Na+ symporter
LSGKPTLSNEGTASKADAHAQRKHHKVLEVKQQPSVLPPIYRVQHESGRKRRNKYSADILKPKMAIQPSAAHKGDFSLLCLDCMSLKRAALIAFAIAVGCFVAFVVPIPDGLTPTSMRLLGIFLSTILSLLLLSDTQISIIAGIGMLLLAWTQSTTCTIVDLQRIPCDQCTTTTTTCRASSGSLQTVLEGFADEVNWLVWAAFHLGYAVEHTLLGRRVSLYLMRWFGSSVLGLAYAVFLSEWVLAPFVPSNTARGGGIMLPIVLSVTKTIQGMLGAARQQGDDSEDEEDDRPEVKKTSVGAFLMLCGAHANLISSHFFPTGMAANPLVSKKAAEILGVEFSYIQWVKGVLLPGLVLMALVPLLLHLQVLGMPDWMRSRLRRTRRRYSHLNDTDHTEGQMDSHVMTEIKQSVRHELEKMGRISAAEWKLILVLLGCLALWLSSSWTSFDTTLIALTAVVALILLNVITWNDVVSKLHSPPSSP